MLIKRDFQKSAYLFVSLVLVGSSTSVILTVSVNAIPYSNIIQHQGNKTYGAIASIQNNDEGKPSWILSGRWITNIINLTKDSFNHTHPAIFASSVDMVLLNGSASHKHEISNFSISDISKQDKTITINGTVTVTMKEGPVKDVPIVIKVMDNHAIAISLEASKTNNHFGDTPIYGIISPRADISSLITQEGNTTMMGPTPEKSNVSVIPSSS
jgi:hypothetical protein